jgi:subtilisin family serine protease
VLTSNRTSRRAARSAAPALFITLVAMAVSAAAWSAELPAAAAKLDPRLLADALSGARAPVAVWLEFRDKGEQDPAGLASALARAAASLSPRARARRERARVWPLVDYRDLPVCGAYLDALSGQGLRPIAVSRWFNRAAVRLPAIRLTETAGLPFVERIVPVERALRMRDPVVEGTPLPAGGGAGAARPERHERGASRGPGSGEEAPGTGASRTAIDYGLTHDQLAQLNLPALHDSGYNGAGVLVCLLDSGFKFHDSHEALRDQIIQPGRRRDFVDGDTTVTPDGETPHGTWVMGIIAANKIGTYVGAAYGAEYALGRTERYASETPVEMLYWGMGAEWADSLGADIISSSLGYSVFDPPFTSYTHASMDGHTTDVTRAALIAARKGLLVVTANGNEGNKPWRYLVAPADVDGDSLIAAGAVSAAGDTLSFSSAGPTADGRIKPDLAARGLSNPIVSADGDPLTYAQGSGTSFATPLLAGLAACLMQAHPQWTPRDVIQAMRSSASRASLPDNKMGYGIPDAMAAFQWPVTVPPPQAGYLELRLLGPNPLRAGGAPTRFRFALGQDAPAAVDARLRVLDLQGRRVRTIWSGTLRAGQRMTVPWDARDDRGRALGSGVYWIALEGGGRRKAVRLVALD